jgi:phospholipid/cholesterol/gamma-HCH transport system substrate-binding protein
LGTDLKVGMFLSVGILLMLLLSTQVRDVSLFSDDGYNVTILMDDVLGLELNSKVNANGLDVGYIEDMHIKDNKVIVVLYIYNQFKIPKDSLVRIKAKGMLSGLLVSIELGISDEVLEDGDSLSDVLRFKSMDEAADKVYDAANEFTNLIYRFQGFVGDDTQQSFQQSIKNIESMTKNLENFTASQQKSIDTFVNEATKMIVILKNASGGLDKSMVTLTKQLETILKDIKSSTKQVDGFIKTSKTPIEESIKKVDSIIAEADTYMKDLSKTKLEVALSSHYNVAQNDTRSMFSLMLQPDKDKMYLFDLTSANDYSYDTKTKTRHIPKQYDDSNYLISAQLGNRSNNWLFRAGLIASSGGVGVDYFLLKDHLRTSIDLFDFSAKNYYIEGGNPNLRMTIRYTFLKYIDAYLSYNNALNSEASSASFGLGFRYFDKDFKTVIGVIGNGSI